MHNGNILSSTKYKKVKPFGLVGIASKVYVGQVAFASVFHLLKTTLSERKDMHIFDTDTLVSLLTNT
ncbi:MAG: hypothetical protein QOA13_03465, partial [Nitrososphaeraceae archaeon]|nr:hypothetical protein [Nitrososphaeraceae archaeon]